MGRKVNLAVIGTGRMGSVHVRNVARLIPEANLAALCDLRLDVAQALADEVGVHRVVKDFHDLLADKDIEAVLIAASTDAHAAIMKDCAAAGKHIFCEKPLAMDLASIDAVLEAVRKAGVKLQVGFNRRFDRSFRRVREIVASGKIGSPSLLRITNRDPEVPAMEFMRLSGGMFLDMTIHDFDMARYLAGSDAVEVYAKGAVLVDPAIGKAGDVDTAIVTITFANGCLGVIDNSRRATYGYDQRVEVFGSKGALACGNDFPSSVSLANETGVSGDKPLYFFLERYRQAFLDEMNAFFDTVLDGKPCPVGDIDGLKPLLMGFAAKRSVAEGRPVKISEVEA